MKLRLDYFLPFLKKKQKQGWIRKTLRHLGPTTHSSPVRRAIQAFCFVVFLLLFFYVCWPYTARPRPPGAISTGWSLTNIDQEKGRLHFHREGAPPWTLVVGQTLHIVDEAVPDGFDSYIAPFVVASAEDDGRIALEATRQLSPEQLDTLLLGIGPWSMNDTEPGRWPSHYTDDLAQKQFVPAEAFLVIDPLVSLSTAIAARSWVWSLGCAGVILVVCLLIPRGFCGYVCPLGTLIDLSDWAFVGRVKGLRAPDDGWWVHIKYYLLAGTLLSAVFGILVSGYVAAIPVMTRGMLFLGEPLQTGLMRGWHQVVPWNVGHWFSLALFFLVLGLGLLKPRFWCKYVCPSGALFSIGNLARVTQRKVESSCIHCNKCVEICPFDAIKPDFNTRVTDCTFCQTCGGVCPTYAIKFVDRWNVVDLKVENDPPTGETAIGQRGFLSVAAGAVAAVVGGSGLAAATRAFGARLDDPTAFRPVRPPGSVPEKEFLQMCIRCGECFKVCPNSVLHAEGFQQGLEGLWAPIVNADWAGCESSCNACGQVCPTGAIRPLPLEEKRVARMGLAVVDPETCLPLVGRQACQLCVDECNGAGYHAIEFKQVHTVVDELGRPVEGTGYLAPVVLAHACVGCGLCQTRCHAINVREEGLLTASAIVVEAGEGKEDRMLEGSYRQLREDEARRRALQAEKSPDSAEDYYVPSDTGPGTPVDVDDPFQRDTKSDPPIDGRSDPPNSADPFGIDGS